MLAEVVSGTLVEVIAATGRWLATEAAATRGKRAKEDAAIAEWFDTYKLSDGELGSPIQLDNLAEENLCKALSSNEIQAALHELLAARLTDAPELAIDQVKSIFLAALNRTLDTISDSSIGDSLFRYYDAKICELVGRLEGGQPVLFRAIRQDAFNTRIVAILNAIDAHISAV